MMLSEAYALHALNLQTRACEYTKFTRSRISLGSMISAADYLNAQKTRQLLNDTLRQRFEDMDVMVYAGMLDDPPEVSKIDPFHFFNHR